MSPPFKGKIYTHRGFARLSVYFVFSCAVMVGCTHLSGVHEGAHMSNGNTVAMKSAPHDRSAFVLSPSAEKAHRAVMLEHLESIHEIVKALAQANFSKAEYIAMTELGFAKHREAMRRQQPENFPPVYHDLAMAHHEAAEELAQAMPSHDLKEILLHLERTLNACVACHQTYQR